jgi:hypothetical protein
MSLWWSQASYRLFDVGDPRCPVAHAALGFMKPLAYPASHTCTSLSLSSISPSVLYRQENKRLLCLSQSQNNCIVVSETLLLYVRLESSHIHLEYHVDHPYPAPPLLPDWCMVKTTPLLPIGGHGIIYTKFWAKVLQYPELLSHGPVTSIVWFSLITFIINSNIITLVH